MFKTIFLELYPDDHATSGKTCIMAEHIFRNTKVLYIQHVYHDDDFNEVDC